MWINVNTAGTFILHADIRFECWKSGIELPAVLSDEVLAQHGYMPVTQVVPHFDPITEGLAAMPPVSNEGVWEQHFDVIQLDPIDVANNCSGAVAIPEKARAVLEAAGRLDKVLAGVEQRRIAQLWQSAHDYEYAAVNGSAIGLLAVGVLQGKPKCGAVQGWLKSIWATYYTRKADGSTDFDFSTLGACPHSVPELMAELGL